MWQQVVAHLFARVARALWHDFGQQFLCLALDRLHVDALIGGIDLLCARGGSAAGRRGAGSCIRRGAVTAACALAGLASIGCCAQARPGMLWVLVPYAPANKCRVIAIMQCPCLCPGADSERSCSTSCPVPADRAQCSASSARKLIVHVYPITFASASTSYPAERTMRANTGTFEDARRCDPSRDADTVTSPGA